MNRMKVIQGITPLFLLLILLNALVAFAQQGTIPGATYEVQEADETLEGVAERFDKPAECIQLANDLEADADLTVGQKLLIPDDCSTLIGAGGGPETTESALVTPTPETVTATPTPRPVPTQAALEDQSYIVVPGDRLSKIAEAFEVPMACIVRANRIANPDLIFIGQRLLIPGNCQAGGGGDITADALTTGRTCQFDRYAGRTAPNGVYTIRAGDTLDFIACDFGISLQCLKESNPEIVNNKRLGIGDEVTINLACPPWDGAVIP
jgi:LysM repeat protein